MEQYALIGLGDAQNVARFFRGETFDVAKRDHRPLVVRQRGDRGLDPRTRLARKQPLFGHAARRRRPVTCVPVVGAEEAVDVDGRSVLVAVGSER